MTTPVEFEPAESQTSARGADEVNLLLTFVRDRDHPCPRCGYNLRNLTQPVCPECREALMLKVGARRLRLLPLLLSISPGAFCGIAIGMFLTMFLLLGPAGGMDAEGVILLVFLALSGLLAAALIVRHNAFVFQAESAQWVWAVAIWGVHIVAFIIFYLVAF